MNEWKNVDSVQHLNDYFPLVLSSHVWFITISFLRTSTVYEDRANVK